MRLPLLLAVALASSPALAIKICIDPGHGGGDPGGVGCNLEEEDIVLDVSLRLRDSLQANGFDVIMTRTTDAAVSLVGRTDFVNAQGADRFVSIHANAFGNASANGTETFCHTTSSASSPELNLRDRIQTEMIDAWGLTNRGGKTADFHVLRESNMPATLSELGFVTNCSVDAPILADLGRRQQASDAHLNAIAAHLDVDVDQNPPPATGTANGVVFEDQGVGTDNMDIRLAGATVLIVDTGATVPAGADGGAWTFTLPPGEHTVRASLTGYTTAERTCTVVAGDIAWCSIGLFATAAGEGEGEGEPGEGEGEGEPGEGEGEGEPIGPANDVERVTILPPEDGEGGCGQTGTSGVVVIGALLALLMRRRPSPQRALPMLAIACVFAAPARAADAAEAKAVDARVVARGLYASAMLSPAGDKLLVSDDHYAGLSVVDLKSGHVRMLTEAARAGFRSEWVDATHVAHRNPKRPFDGDPLVTLDLDGMFTGPFVEHRTVRAKQVTASDGEEVTVVVNGAVVSRPDDRCFGPVVSALGDVMFQCLRTGLYVHRASAPANTKPLALGDGTSPAFSADGRMMVFLRTSDEGHVTLESDVVVVDLRKPTPVVLPLAKTDALERAPSLSGDGALISWIVDDTVVLARLSLPR